MTVVEEYLTALFAQIPARTTNGIEVRKPFYHFGDGKEANKFIAGHNTDCYPLIYQISNQETHVRGYVTTNLELVLCTQNKCQDQYNSERWELSYKNILVPLCENVQKCLEESGVIDSVFSYTIRKEPNYSVSEAKESNAYIDIVDAIVLSVEVKIRPKGCIVKTIFNT